ncbi:hypothetical protein EYV94_15310 [Puteibacter caeruleilacunae]|nr:hypothetical protein EYV94_15310 [Puteibacter caeruleilacunae]
MKILFLLLSIIMLTSSLYAQDVKKQATKMDEFASQTGVILKFVDYSLPKLKLTLGVAETKVRKLIKGGEARYFYQISYNTKYGTKTASIAYEDLVEVVKALSSLKSEMDADKNANPDYLENKFVTEDGFQVGYYVSAGKVKWYLVLERFGSGNTVFINSAETVESAFNEAKAKIEELKG